MSVCIHTRTHSHACVSLQIIMHTIIHITTGYVCIIIYTGGCDMYAIFYHDLFHMVEYWVVDSIGSLACQVHQAHQELANHSTKCSSLSVQNVQSFCLEFPSFHTFPQCFPQVTSLPPVTGHPQEIRFSLGWGELDPAWSTEHSLNTTLATKVNVGETGELKGCGLQLHPD